MINKERLIITFSGSKNSKNFFLINKKNRFKILTDSIDDWNVSSSAYQAQAKHFPIYLIFRTPYEIGMLSSPYT